LTGRYTPQKQGRVIGYPVLSRLHHHYERFRLSFLFDRDLSYFILRRLGELSLLIALIVQKSKNIQVCRKIIARNPYFSWVIIHIWLEISKVKAILLPDGFFHPHALIFSFQYSNYAILFYYRDSLTIVFNFWDYPDMPEIVSKTSISMRFTLCILSGKN